MLRLMLPIVIMYGVSGAALATDQLAVPAAAPHGKKTTRVDHAPPPPSAAAAERDPDALISPSLPTTPILFGSQALPGNYGGAFDYDYQQGGYYGGDNLSYLFRLPYACGIYGYC